jgi:hypothetical protein
MKPLLNVFGAHAGCTRRSAVGELANYSPQLSFGRNIVVDFSGGDINWEGVTWRKPPCIKIYSLRSLALHRLAARFCLHIRRGPIPPLEVAEGLLDIPSRELQLNQCPNVGQMISSILVEGRANLTV